MNSGKPSSAASGDSASLESIDRQSVERLGEAYRKITDEVRLETGREIVEHEDIVVRAQQRVDDVGPDEARSAGDDDLHRPVRGMHGSHMASQ